MLNKIPPFFEIYNSLIKIPSISSINKSLDTSNKEIINLLANYFNDLKFSVEIQKIPNTNNKFNLLASKQNYSGGLLLSGHTDTVPCDINLWSNNPFSLIEYNNKYYGLGTVDMKGFFALVIEVLKNISTKKIKKSLYILATADEETTMSGASFFSKNTHLKPDCIIIGEPTSLEIVTAHKGHISISIITKGNSGHSSNPDIGANSIEIMNAIISNLLILKKNLKEKYKCEGFTVNYPTLNFGKIYGGHSSNQICSLCELNLDIRPTPNLKLKTVEYLINKQLKTIIHKWPKNISITNLHPSIPSYQCTSNSTIVNRIEKLLNKSSTKVNYCTEASFLQKIAPTIILGPGSIKQAHQHDEFIDMSYIPSTKKILLQLIENFCY